MHRSTYIYSACTLFSSDRGCMASCSDQVRLIDYSVDTAGLLCCCSGDRER